MLFVSEAVYLGVVGASILVVFWWLGRVDLRIFLS